jgi:protein required for attachment to host cells
MAKIRIRNLDWVVVLDGRKALFLQNEGDELHLNLAVREVRDQPDPRNRELFTDRPGKVYQSATTSHSAVELTDRHDAAEHAFIKASLSRLDQLMAPTKHSCHVIVAPPRALGVIRKLYTSALTTTSKGELAHDWVRLPVHEIESRLVEIAKG